MQLIRLSASGLSAEVDAATQGAVLAVGNFDGVHLGHRELIRVARQQAFNLNAPLGILVFEPHPKRFFDPASPPFYLTPLRRKFRLFQSLGADRLYVMRFDRNLCEMSTEVFVCEILATRLQARHVVAGQGFRFGRKRLGDLHLLKRIGKKMGIGVTGISALVDPHTGQAYSSSVIRKSLTAGEVQLANRQLGSPWEIGGRVRHGQQRGRQILGFPTANVNLYHHLRPALGVYAVRASISDAITSDVSTSDTGIGAALGGNDKTHWWDGIANLGQRPTFEGSQAQDARLEVHLLDQEGAMYGRHMRVQMLTFIRPERRFDTPEALRRQIETDIIATRSALSNL